MPLSQSAFAEMESVRRRSRRLYLPFSKRLYEKSSERRTAHFLSMPGPKKGFVRPLGPFVRAQFGIYRDFSYSLEERNFQKFALGSDRWHHALGGKVGPREKSESDRRH